MLSREDRILTELIVSRGLVDPAVLEHRARDLERSDESGLMRALVSHGELDPETGRRVSDEAREIDGLLRADLPEGDTLGEFRLVREIGRGGMGIVYEAEQLPLGRRVALKVLPAGAALDERLAIRFLREARTAARLTHPGIVPVFGTGREKGVLFFAMELVDGESLACRIERGPVAPTEAARLGSEVARALQHAHEAGLVHRDVKPDNVIVGRDGRARLMDFGLVFDRDGARLTRSQFVLGTPAYSAPEQARGEPVDPRSDVYGVGAVLYAMLAGAPPFPGEVPAAVLRRLMSEPPAPLARVAPSVPSALIVICERAMAQEPARRHPSPGALADELDRFLEQGGVAAVPRSTSRLAWLGGISVVLATLVAIALYVGHREQEDPLPAPADSPGARAGLMSGTHRLLSGPRGLKRDAALSPDGQTIAYSLDAGDGRGWRIYFQGIDGSEAARALPVDGDPWAPAWSPDGTRLGYCRGGRLELLEIATGDTAVVAATCGRMSWSADGRHVVFEEREWPATRLRLVELESGASRWITGPGVAGPSWSHDGERIAFIALSEGRYDLWTIPAAGGEPTRVTDDEAREWRPVWLAEPGALYFGSDRDGSPDLWRVTVDAETGRPLAEPSAVTRGLGGALFSLSSARERERLAVLPLVNASQLWELPLDVRANVAGPPLRLPVDVPLDAYSLERAGDREEWIVVVPHESGTSLHVVGLDASSFERVTDGPHRDEAPRWSPDGRWVAFHSDRSGRNEIWKVRRDGEGLERLTDSASGARFPVWSSDGERIAYIANGAGAWVVGARGDGARALAPEIESEARGDGSTFLPSSWSPDGRYLAGTRDGIVLFDLEERRYERVTDFGDRPTWLDSQNLLFTHGDRIYRWRAAQGDPVPLWTSGPSRLVSGVSVASEGSGIYFAGRTSSDEVWIVDP